MKWIMADKVLTLTIYDEEHEDHMQKRMTVEDILDKFTDEGCPTIYSNPDDVEPVVRCKDCRFSDWYTTGGGKQLCYCMEHGSSGHEENDYCSYGARMDGEQDATQGEN